MDVMEREKQMSKKIIAVNAGPRKGWNTDTLIMEAEMSRQGRHRTGTPARR